MTDSDDRSVGVRQELASPDACSHSPSDLDGKAENEVGESQADGASDHDDLQQSRELTPPPLPPRPKDLEGHHDKAQTAGVGSLRLSKRASRPQLLSHATTALSSFDVHTQSRSDAGSLKSSPASRAVSRRQSLSHIGHLASGGEFDDTASLGSYAPTLEAGVDKVSLPADEVTLSAWQPLDSRQAPEDPFEKIEGFADPVNESIVHEFDTLDPYENDGGNEQMLLNQWGAKLKQFFILSASGKPIYSRHGDDQLISHYIGVVQTIVSFFQTANNPLRGFVAGDTRFAMLAKGPLNLVAISKLGESEAQLRNQLESLYMQILSTLTLPSLEKMFSMRPSTDLRRPLQGTEVLLDGLADGFTRGSPSTLLSALECLRMRKTQRRLINETLLKVRSPNLLYGLVVAAGRLVSVVRPKKHSLHPGDLHLIFNMLFEAGSVKANGGENWIPICLPGFNNTGYLYMYVSFLAASDANTTKEETNERPSLSRKDDEIAIVLISASRDSFFELRKMRDDLVATLQNNGSMSALRTAITRGHAACSDIVPGTVLRHFLYKSRGNVQFTMPSLQPAFNDLVARRKLMTLYHHLHESMHSRTAHLKVQHCVALDATALAWETPLFELYCVAGPRASRADMTQGANKVVQWIRREEERVFIIGGAVF